MPTRWKELQETKEASDIWRQKQQTKGKQGQKHYCNLTKTSGWLPKGVMYGNLRIIDNQSIFFH